MKTRVHLYISGRVQGVFFRDSSRQMAKSLGVTGYASNLPDGRVEVVIEGDIGSVNSLIQWCRKGPSHAFVESVEVLNELFIDEFKDFEVRR